MKMSRTTINYPPPKAIKTATTPTKKQAGLILHDSSWITKLSGDTKHKTLEKTTNTSSKLEAMKAMTDAFEKSMRCSLEDAESKTSREDKIDCIHFGNLLVALDAMKDCLQAHGMYRTVADLEYHYSNARRLYDATAPESRDYLSCLLLNHQYNNTTNPEQQQQQQAKSLRESPEAPLNTSSEVAAAINSLSFVASVEPTATEASSFTPSTTANDRDGGGEYLPPVASSDRERAQLSMFWLCYFVRYMYNVHRLVLEEGHDPVDASSMAFMRYLNPYFGDYYHCDMDGAKAFLKLLTDYQNEHFLGDRNTTGGSDKSERNNNSLDAQSMQELKLFLEVLEIVMYLWTPAFQEMALKGGEFRNR